MDSRNVQILAKWYNSNRSYEKLKHRADTTSKMLPLKTTLVKNVIFASADPGGTWAFTTYALLIAFAVRARDCTFNYISVSSLFSGPLLYRRPSILSILDYCIRVGAMFCVILPTRMSYQCAMSHEAAEIVHCMRFNELATEPIGKFAKTCTYLPYYADIASWNIWQKMRLTFLLIGCIHDTFMVQIMSFFINLVSAIAVKLLRTLN